MKNFSVALLVPALFAFALPHLAQAQQWAAEIDGRVEQVTPRVTEWRRDIHEPPELGNRKTRTPQLVIAQSAGATATVAIAQGAALTYNDPALTERMSGTLSRVAGADHVSLAPLVTGAEDFSYYQQQVPGLSFFLGVAPEGADLSKVAPNHSPHFSVDESALPAGVRALSYLTVGYLTGRR